MVERPICIVRADAATPVRRPAADGVGFVVRPLSDIGGLTQMGVKIREIEPGLAGTHFHFHDCEEEWAFVLRGAGRVRIGPLALSVRPGSFVAFPAGPRPHHFVAEGAEPLVLLEGGERRRGEDYCTYPDLGVRSRDGLDEAIDSAELPEFSGEERQLVHLEDVPERRRPHPLTAAAVRNQRDIDGATGLQRQACAWVRVEPGVSTTTFHTHERTDEWVYLLSGEAEVRLGDAWYPVRGGDFIAHPARGPAHVMRATTEITYLMGGQSIGDDVVTYPELGMQLTRDGFEKSAAVDT